jgi:nucleoside-diphosphate-sugar epimerase
MNVFVAGGTGDIGRPAVRALVAAGHTVRALARGREKAALLRELGAEPVQVDLFDVDGMTKAVAGSEAVLRLATHVPPTAKMRSRRAWDEHDRIRTEGARVVVEAAIANAASVVVQEAVTYVYANGDDTWLDEDAPVDAPPGSNLVSALETERETARFTASGGRGIVLRLGGFYSATSRTTHDSIRLARRRMFPIVGDGNFYVSSIHTDDGARAIVAALDAPAGVYNVCDDGPVLERDYVRAIADAFGFKRPRRVPVWLARRMAGTGGDYLTRSQRVSNRRFKEATGWAPIYPSVREGFRAIAAGLTPEG